MRKTRARHLVIVRKKTAQLFLVTLLTGQQSGAAPCRCSDASTFPSLLKFHSACSSGADPWACSPLCPLCLVVSPVKDGGAARSQQGGVREANRQQLGCISVIGERSEDVSLWCSRGVTLKLQAVVYNMCVYRHLVREHVKIYHLNWWFYMLNWKIKSIDVAVMNHYPLPSPHNSYYPLN